MISLFGLLSCLVLPIELALGTILRALEQVRFCLIVSHDLSDRALVVGLVFRGNFVVYILNVIIKLLLLLLLLGRLLDDLPSKFPLKWLVEAVHQGLLLSF